MELEGCVSLRGGGPQSFVWQLRPHTFITSPAAAAAPANAPPSLVL